MSGVTPASGVTPIYLIVCCSGLSCVEFPSDPQETVSLGYEVLYTCEISDFTLYQGISCQLNNEPNKVTTKVNSNTCEVRFTVEEEGTQQVNCNVFCNNTTYTVSHVWLSDPSTPSTLPILPSHSNQTAPSPHPEVPSTSTVNVTRLSEDSAAFSCDNTPRKTNIWIMCLALIITITVD